jgi:ribosome-binding factor A
MLSNRQLKVGETIKRALSQIISKDIYIYDGLYVTLSRVMMTADLGIADVYILPLITQEISDDQLIKILNTAAPKIRHLLAKQVLLKTVPQLRFKIDNSFAEASRIEELLKR